MSNYKKYLQRAQIPGFNSENYEGVEEEEVEPVYTYDVEKNPDRYRGGYKWSISRNDDIIHTDLSPTEEEAHEEAEKYLAKLGVE